MFTAYDEAAQAAIDIVSALGSKCKVSIGMDLGQVTVHVDNLINGRKYSITSVEDAELVVKVIDKRS